MRRLSSHWLARFHRRRRALVVGVALPTIALVAGITAFAYWTTTGSGDASASVGTLDSTTITTHEATGTSVALAWDAVVPPDPDTVEYYVLRDDAPAGGICGSAASPIPSLTCTDTVPASSTPTSYSYEIVAVWRSWTSESDAVAVDVKASQTIVFTSTAPSGAKVGGSTYEVAATGGGSGNPVTFTIDPSASSVCSIAGSTVSFTAVGTCRVNANQAGNASYEPAAQVQQSFAVAKGDQTIGFGALADKRFDESPVTVSATTSSGLAASFSSATPGVCTIAGASVSFVSVGTCTVNVNQAGSTDWNAAPLVQQSFQVTKGNMTISFAALADKRFDESLTVVATASSGLTVSFSSSTPSVCTTGGANGATIGFVSAGTCTINADQVGNGNWNPAPQVQRSLQVLKGNQTISFAALVDKRLDESLTVVASASSGLTVSFTTATPGVCSVSGTSVTFSSVGTCTINADQGGNGNWNPAPQVQRSLQVLKGNQTLAFTSTAPSSAIAGGASYTASATASSGLAVTFGTGSPTVCTSGGPNGATLAFTAVGTCIVSATQPGDANWNPAAPVAQTFAVGKASPTLSVSAPATGTVGTAIAAASITATLASSSGANATAPITFRVFGPQSSAPTTCTSGGATVGTATPAGNGTYQSSAFFTPSGAGTYWWYVSSPSDANNNAAASACASPSMTRTVVTAAPTRLSFTSCTTSAGSSSSCTTVGTATVTLKKANQGGGTWTARVTLVDASGSPIVNTTGSAIVVTLSKTNTSAVLTFSAGSALTIPNGSSESTNSFTYDNTGASNGNGTDTVTGSSAGLTSAIGNVTW